MEKFLVIVVTYNAMQWLERCLESVYASSIIPDVFIVDNGSTDGTQTYIARRYPQVLFKQSDINLRFGQANNIGLRYALENNYDYAYLLNQDAWVFPDTFEKLVAVSTKFPEYGVLSPFQIEANLQHLDRNFKVNTCSGLSCPELIDTLYFDKETEVLTVHRTVMAAHWLITSDCIKKVGGFSPIFHQYGEDNNYLDRLRYHGLLAGLVLDAKAVHDREHRPETLARQIMMSEVAMKRMLSSPMQVRYNRLVVLCKMACSDMVRLKSLKPFACFFKFLCQYPSIMRSVKVSQEPGHAFL